MANRTLAESLALLPTDRHIRYTVEIRGGRPLWLARWFDDAHVRRSITLGRHLPADRPDHPCQHLHNLYTWRVPTTEAERQQAIERGRRANAARKVRSNQYRKRREEKSA